MSCTKVFLKYLMDYFPSDKVLENLFDSDWETLRNNSQRILK